MKRVCALAGIFWLASSLQAPSQQFTAPPLQLSTARSVFVREFHFEGNTVFTRQELARITAPFTGRELTREELEDARRAVSLHYAQHGYINSGAVLPEQKWDEGIVTMRIIEGALTDIALSGNRWLCRRYLKDRLRHWAGQPLNVAKLREGLQLLRQNPNIDQINAELRPGAAPGESLLELRVKDQQPFRLGLQLDNSRPPSVGSMEVLALASDQNLTGHSDPLEVIYGIADGAMQESSGVFSNRMTGRLTRRTTPAWKLSDFDNVSGSYSVPVTRWDTQLRVFGNKNNYAIIDEALVTNNVMISSESYRVGANVRQPVYQTASREFALALTFDRRYSKSEVNGFPFPLPGAPNGINEISALRFSQEWVDRTLNQVIAFRSTVSIGIDAFGTTDDGTERDAKFVVWLGQFQYVRRLFNTQNQLILRTDVQWTDDPLLSLEQFSVGGSSTVRGYRENSLVRDRGVVSSVELRLPVMLNKLGAPVIQLAPFFDFGAARNVGAGHDSPEPRAIVSAGIGVLATPNKHINASLYWGYAFWKFDTANNDPQDLGLHFRITVNAF